MKLQGKLIALLAFYNITLVWLSYRLLNDRILSLFVAEGLIVVSLVVAVHFYKSLVRPLNLISSGIEFIKEKNFNVRFVKVGQQELDKLISIYNGMVDQLAEEKAKQQEQHFFLEKLIAESPVGTIILDYNDRVTLINTSAQTISGFSDSEIIGEPLSEINSSLFKQLCTLKVDQSEVFRMQNHKSVRILKSCFMEKGFNRNFIILEELTQEIYETEKKTFEMLIRTMSHEVNNSIGAINSILDSSLHYSDQLQEEDRNDFSNAIEVAMGRNQKLVQFMSDLANVVRLPKPETEKQELNRMINNVAMLMRAKCLSKGIQLKTETVPDSCWVDLDPQQFEQVLVNIITNSIESIDRNGIISLIVVNHSKTSLIVRDNGKGVSAQNQADLFKPFFSTKKGGHGIGLMLTKQILFNHGFTFSLETKQSGMTEFTINF